MSPMSIAPSRYVRLSVVDGLSALNKDFLNSAKELVDPQEAAARFVIDLRDVTKAEQCLLLFPHHGHNFRVGFGVGTDMDNIRSNLELNDRGRTTVLTTMLENNIDVPAMDFSKLHARSRPDFLAEFMPKAQMMLMLPLLDRHYIAGILLLTWNKANSLTQFEVLLLKELRTACSTYLLKAGL